MLMLSPLTPEDHMFNKVLNVVLLVILSAIGGYVASENKTAIADGVGSAVQLVKNTKTKSECSCGTCTCQPKCQCGE
jgi:uncharacterized protein (UPF0333 family)